MGMVYRPKYKRADGTVAVSAIYWMKYYVDGVARRESTKKTSERAAKGVLQIKEGNAAQGNAMPAKVNRKTVAEILAGVVQDYRINDRRSLSKVEDRIRLHLAPAFGTWNAASVRKDDIRAFIVRRQAAKASNAEINRELAILRRAYRLADDTVTVRPKITMLKEAAPREGFFEPDQFAAVMRHLPADLAAGIQFAYITGWRVHSEVFALPWRLVDFERGEVRLERGMTKNSEGRVFPFNEALLALLTEQRAHTDAVQRARGMVVPWVFHRNGKKVTDLYGAWDSACEAAGCPDRIMHDLRRTAVMNLTDAGVLEGVAMQLTGHKTRSVFERYNIINDKRLRDATERLHLATGKVSGKVAAIRGAKGAAGARK